MDPAAERARPRSARSGRKSTGHPPPCRRNGEAPGRGPPAREGEKATEALRGIEKAILSPGQFKRGRRSLHLQKRRFSFEGPDPHPGADAPGAPDMRGPPPGARRARR